MQRLERDRDSQARHASSMLVNNMLHNNISWLQAVPPLGCERSMLPSANNAMHCSDHEPVVAFRIDDIVQLDTCHA